MPDYSNWNTNINAAQGVSLTEGIIHQAYLRAAQRDRDNTETLVRHIQEHYNALFYDSVVFGQTIALTMYDEATGYGGLCETPQFMNSLDKEIYNLKNIGYRDG